MNDNREITISKEEYDELRKSKNLLDLYRETLRKCAVYSEWRRNCVDFNEEKLYETIDIFDTLIAGRIKIECERQKEEKEKAEKPSFPEIKKED